MLKMVSFHFGRYLIARQEIRDAPEVIKEREGNVQLYPTERPYPCMIIRYATGPSESQP
jgi:hypothetical protein